MAISVARTVFIGFASISGAAAGLWGQPLIHGNAEAVNIVVTTFSILAGFLIAIMTILGAPGLFARSSWRSAEIQRGESFRKLVRQKWLFILYLLTLGLALAASLIAKVYLPLSVILEHLFLGFAVFAFILSLGLPSALMAIQTNRLDELIKMRREQAGIIEPEADA